MPKKMFGSFMYKKYIQENKNTYQSEGKIYHDTIDINLYFIGNI